MPVIGKVLRAIILAVILAGACATGLRAESGQPREYLVKAAFLYNFAKFVEWPNGTFSDESSPLTLCILGHDPFGKNIESIRGKTIMGRELVIRPVSSVDEINGCQIVFISESERGQVARILRYAKTRNVLTVSDMKSFARDGGIIGFTMKDNKVRFEINVDGAERSELKISSKLLKLATIIRDR